MTNQEKFIENVNEILQDVDFEKLDQSCNGGNPEYAKEVLGQMHGAFISAYGCNYLERGGYGFVELPAVIRGRNGGHVTLGIVTVDLHSSGEHWGTFLLTPKGVLDQGSESLTEADRNYLRENFAPYDYWYTPTVGGDIHVDFENVPESVQSFLKSYRQGQGEQQEGGMGMNL